MEDLLSPLVFGGLCAPTMEGLTTAQDRGLLLAAKYRFYMDSRFLVREASKLGS